MIRSIGSSGARVMPSTKMFLENETIAPAARAARFS